MNNLDNFNTEQLIDEIAKRCNAFAMSVEIPGNHDPLIINRWGGNTEFYKSLGYAGGLIIDMESVLHHECQKIRRQEDDEVGE